MSASINASGDRPLEQLKVAELREELKKRGLGQKGVKKELFERLEEAIRSEGQLEPLNPDLVITVDEKHSQDGHVGSVSEEESEGDGDERKTERNVKSVIPDQVDSASWNQELEQAAGMEADVGAVTREIVPQVSVCKEFSPQHEPKHELANEVNRNFYIKSNDGESGVSGLASQVEDPTEIEAPWVSDAVKDCSIQAPGANSVGSLERDARALTLSASAVKADFEAEPGMTNLEPDESHQQTANTNLADNNKELAVEIVKVEDVQSEEACPGQPTASVRFVGSEPLHESLKYQSDDDEGRASRANICPLSEIKLERDYGLEGNANFQVGVVVDRDEEKNANLVQFLPPEGMKQGEDIVLTGEEQEITKNTYGDEKSGREYVKMLEGGGTDRKGLELKTWRPHVELIEDRRENGYKSMEIDIPAYLRQKRKEEEVVTRQQEPAKRLRRWNSGKTVEAAKPPTTGTVKETILSDGKDVASSVTSPKTTPKVVATSRPTSVSVRVDLLANGGREMQRLVPPASRSPTTSLKVDRFLRPFTLKAVKELLSQTGTFIDFWMDQIKTHCYVTYSSVEEAIATRNALYNLQWPLSFGNSLIVDFVDPEEVKVRCNGRLEKQAVTPTITPRAGVLAPPSLPVAPSPIPSPPTLPGPPPLPPARERPTPPPKKEPEPPIPTLDDLFKKTKAKPHIYYLPLSDEDVSVKIAAKKRESQIRDPLVRA